MAKLASKVYGEALFEVAIEENRVDEVMEEIQAVQKVLTENQEFSRLMEHPKIIREEKLQMIEACFKDQISDTMTGFLTVVAAKGRFQELPQILEYVVTRMKEHKKIGVVEITSAVTLSDEWKRKIEEKLLGTTRYETLEVSYQTDESLIGGLIIRIGDRVVDSSLKYKLEQLQSQLLGISLEEGKEGERAS